MSETDELVKRLRARKTADKFVQTGPGMVTLTDKDDPLTTEAAARLEAQATALTASQETIDAQQARIAELEGALRWIAENDDAGDLMYRAPGPFAKRARAALAKHDTEKEGA